MSEEQCPIISRKEIESEIAMKFSPAAAKKIMEIATAHRGGMKGGVNCKDLSNVPKYLALFAIAIAAGCAVKSVPLGKAFDEHSFKHLFEFIRNFQLGMAFTERISGYITSYFSGNYEIPQKLKNFISIWCQFETDRNMDNAKQLIIKELTPVSLDTPVTIESINDLLIENNSALITKIRDMLVDRHLAVVQKGKDIIDEEIERQNAAANNDDDNDEEEYYDASSSDASDLSRGGKKSKRRKGRKSRKTRVLRKKRR